MPRPILRMRMVWRYPSWKRNLLNWMAGMPKAMRLCCWADLVSRRTSIIWRWVTWVVKKRCVLCWHRLFTEIRITCCLMSRPMIWIWTQWHGWKNICPTLSIPYWWWVMTVTSLTLFVHIRLILTLAKWICLPVIIVSGTSPVSWHFVSSRTKRQKPKRRKRNWKSLSVVLVRMWQRVNRLPVARRCWRNWM